MSDILGVGKAVEKLLDPLADLIKRVAGPAADEIGLCVQDSIRVYRANRQYQLLQKMSSYIEQAGFRPNRVPLKLLLPALDYASVEEDEDLHSKWAALLSNAAKPDADEVPAAFPDILRQLSPRDAALLFALHHEAWEKTLPGRRQKLTPAEAAADTSFLEEGLSAVWVKLGYTKTGKTAWNSPEGTEEEERNKADDRRGFRLAFENLARLGLLDTETELSIPFPHVDSRLRNYGGGHLEHTTECRYKLSAIACRLIEACTPPKPEAAPLTYHEL